MTGRDGLHQFGDLLREVVGDGVLMLKDRFAPAEWDRLFLDDRSFLAGAA